MQFGLSKTADNTRICISTYLVHYDRAWWISRMTGYVMIYVQYELCELIKQSFVRVCRELYFFMCRICTRSRLCSNCSLRKNLLFPSKIRQHRVRTRKYVTWEGKEKTGHTCACIFFTFLCRYFVQLCSTNIEQEAYKCNHSLFKPCWTPLSLLGLPRRAPEARFSGHSALTSQ